MLNENADPSVMKDMHRIFDEMVPENQSWYTHRSEGSDDMPAHAKSALCGHSLSIPIVNGHLGLGIWQGICLCEFRNHASGRTIVLTVIS
jgi:secondary thiamine-phosphate synthase enzyme